MIAGEICRCHVINSVQPIVFGGFDCFGTIDGKETGEANSWLFTGKETLPSGYFVEFGSFEKLDNVTHDFELQKKS